MKLDKKTTVNIMMYGNIVLFFVLAIFSYQLITSDINSDLETCKEAYKDLSKMYKDLDYVCGEESIMEQNIAINPIFVDIQNETE